MTAEVPRLTVQEAAARLGLSPSGFRSLAKREGIEVRRRGPLPGVSAADVERFAARARVQRFLSAQEAAAYMGLSAPQFQLMARRAFVHRRASGLYAQDDLDAWLDHLRVRPGDLRSRWVRWVGDRGKGEANHVGDAQDSPGGPTAHR